MLSILIPIYNFDVGKLVVELQKQAKLASIDFEILLFDDASDIEFRVINRKYSTFENVIYKELEVNIGRSKIRNLMCSEAQFEYLLFLDCDASISNPNFINNYIEECKPNAIVCGGMGYFSEYVSINSTDSLRFHYGFKRECLSLSQRLQNPNDNFMTFNFLIAKSILLKTRFDESIQRYGHEDTLFGISLQKNGYTIKHIENVAYHLELDSNDIFLKKSLMGVENLFQLIENNSLKSDLQKSVKLLKYYCLIEKWHCKKCFALLYRFAGKSIEKQIIKNGKNLFIFDFYRLIYLCSLN